MTATTGFAATWIWLALFGGASGFYWGGAPLPLDPVLSSIAPEECLWYASYAGQGPADPKSGNHTEQLLADAQVRKFADEVYAQVMKGLRRAAGSTRDKRVLLEQGPKLLRALLTRPSAMYVEEVKPRDGSGVDVSAAFVLNAGDQRAEVEAALAELLKLGSGERNPLQVEEASGIRWQLMVTPAEGPTVRFGWKDAYFIIAVGDATAGRVVERMGGSAPAWLAELRREHPIERELSLGYLNVAGILERIRPLVEARDPKAWPAAEALGLTHVRAVHSVTGFDAVACKSMTHLVTDGERAGVLGLLPHEPLQAGDLQLIPIDAFCAVAVRANAAELWDHGVALASELNPRAGDDADDALWEIESKLGVHIRDDVLDSLGDVWTLHVPSGELMLSWINSTVAVRVKDADALGGAVEKLVDAAQAEMGQHKRSGSISESKLGERTLYTFQLPEPAPISPSWCVGDEWLVLGLSPVAVRTALEAPPAKSLAESPLVQETLSAEGGASMLTYQDTPNLVRAVYPWLQIGLQMASGELRKHGVEIDPTLLPSRDAVVKHLQPGVAALRLAPDGFHFTSRQSLPGGGNLAAAGPVGAALVLPAVGSARHAARSSQSMNNMRQMMLAIHNYHDARKAFPTDIYDKDGKAILSWRVRLLPYMEQQALYDQLKLDEPWDSEHNRRFTSTVAPTFDSPEGPGGGKTRYLALKGPGGVFDGEKAISFKQMTDGLSNTIAFVEVAPEQAVPWAKPADLKFDEKNPVAGLTSPKGTFLAAICDGSVQRMTPDPEVVKAMVTYAGGEAVTTQER